MVYVTHDQTEALTFADKVVVMYEGEVVQIGTPEDLFERPAHTFVGYFIGSPGMNVAPVEITRQPRRARRRRRSRWRAPMPICRPARRSSSASGRNSSALSGNGAGMPGRVVSASTTSAATVVTRRPRRPPASTRSPTRTRASTATAPASCFDPANVHIYADGHLVDGKPFGGSGMMDKTWNNNAWFMVLPVLILVAFNAIIPLMTVVNYSVQETFGDNVFFFHGVELVRGRAAFRALPRGAAAAS